MVAFNDRQDAYPTHAELIETICNCTRCPRLVEHREKVARRKRRAYADEPYWGKPVPSLGDPDARLLIVGLAPGAHGANRTGRMFTGDRSGDFLYPTLHRFGFCNQPQSCRPGDDLELQDTYITAALHCVPPGNKPAAQELTICRAFLVRELGLLRSLQVVVVLGGIAFKSYLAALRDLGYTLPRPLPRFGHGHTCEVAGVELISSYHPSQQNTLTGRLTQEMFDEIFRRARDRVDGLEGLNEELEEL